MTAPSKPDQTGPAPVTPSGVRPEGQPPGAALAQAGEYLTTAQGLRLPDTDHSLKAGPRGPQRVLWHRHEYFIWLRWRRHHRWLFGNEGVETLSLRQFPVNRLEERLLIVREWLVAPYPRHPELRQHRCR